MCHWTTPSDGVANNVKITGLQWHRYVQTPLKIRVLFQLCFLKYLLAKSSSVFRGVLLLLKKGNNKCFKGIWGQAKTYCTAKLSRKNHPKMFRLLSFLKLATFQELSLKGYSPENSPIPWKSADWKTSLSFWNGPFSGDVRALSEGS